MKKRETHWYRGAWDRANSPVLPNRLVEAFHRWWWRKQYAMLPEFFRDFYPFDHALSLLIQNATHQMASVKSIDELASASLRKVVGLERELTQTRLALANAQLGWNEDRVDDFMGKWFVPVSPTTPTERSGR